MAGTIEGAAKARDKILARDPDFYKRIGARGGANSRTGGFYARRDIARVAGAKGGQISRRGPAKPKDKINV